MAIVAASTHPTARWTDQQQHREGALPVADRRFPAAGATAGDQRHAHPRRVEDEDLRIDLMNQVGYFLPHLLALSTSSPFWRGRGDRPQGLSGRTVANDLPRSGTPERFCELARLAAAGRGAGGDRPVRGRDPDLVGHPTFGPLPDAGAAGHRRLHRPRRRADDRRALSVAAAPSVATARRATRAGAATGAC